MLRSFAKYLPLLLVVPVAGCLDAGKKDECVGLSCGGGLLWPDGGEIRLQYIRLPDGNELTRVIAFFLEDQDPDMSPLPPLGNCNTMNAAELQSDDRVYIDVGPSVTLDIGDGELVAPKMSEGGDGEMGMDLMGRSHDIFYQVEVNEPRADSFFNTFHTPRITGDVPFSDQVNNSGLFMGPKQTVLKPAAGPATVEIPRGEDFVIEWEENEPFAPGIAHAAATVFFVPGAPPLGCFTPDSGQLVVPAEAIAELQGNNGAFLVGSVTNEAFLREDGRIVNIWGIYCQMFTFQRVN